MDETVRGLYQECSEMGREMIRLEAASRLAYLARDYSRVGGLGVRREAVQVERSKRLREIWTSQRET